MTQAICDITTDEVNVDIVVEPQADTMVEVANRAGGMEQVFHDETLIGNGNSIDLGVNTDIIATKEYVNENKVDAYTKSEVDNKVTVLNTGITGNAQAIQKTREDYIQADSEIHQTLNRHTNELTTLRGNQASLGAQVSNIEHKIPESASGSNPLVTKADLKDIDLDDYVKKSGDTMIGDLSFDIVDDKYKNIMWNPESEVWVDDITVETRKYLVGPKIVSTGFDILQQYPTYQNASVVLGGVSIESDRFYPAKSDGVMQLGLRNRRWDITYTQKLNSGASGNDLIVPAEGGTLARLEDVANKQDKLTAGDNIIISNNVISATGAGGGAGFDIVVVQELPATGQKGIIYLLAKDGTAPDVYDEYVWITATQTFELIGSTKVDLSGYLPLSGGTITGPITLGMTGDPFSNVDVLKSSSGASLVTGMIESGSVLTLGVRTPLTIFKELLPLADVGQSFSKVPRIYLEKINNGADISIPTTGGTMALAENVETAISDAVANIDALPDQTGNAGKVLTTDGSTASWQEAPASGTKVIIKRYN